MNIGVILAGGKGVRFQDGLPKQFIKIAGKTVVEHTIDLFEACAEIDEIAVVCNPEFVHLFEDIFTFNGYKKVKKILMGGNERYASTYSALSAYADYPPETKILFHDAVRPLASRRMIKDCIAALDKYNAVDTAIKTADTIIEVDGGFINSIPNRANLMSGQTPQAFRLKTIAKAYSLGLKDPNFRVSDDCGVVMKYLPDEKIFVVYGDEANHKLTHKIDAFIIDKLFQLRAMSLDERCDFDALKDKVLVVFGGNSGIGECVAKQAAKHGGKVYAFSRREGNVDISDFAAVQKAYQSVYRKEGKIDYVINTAALLIKTPLVSMDYKDIKTSIDTNYLGAINVTLAAFNYLKQSKGMVLHYTSSSYTRGRQHYSIYSSTKAALVNFVQAIAEEWDSHGIRINCINPERTKTPMRVQNFGFEPDQTLLMPDVVAQASLNTLLSDFTGQIIDVRREP